MCVGIVDMLPVDGASGRHAIAGAEQGGKVQGKLVLAGLIQLHRQGKGESACRAGVLALFCKLCGAPQKGRVNVGSGRAVSAQVGDERRIRSAGLEVGHASARVEQGRVQGIGGGFHGGASGASGHCAHVEVKYGHVSRRWSFGFQGCRGLPAARHCLQCVSAPQAACGACVPFDFWLPAAGA